MWLVWRKDVVSGPDSDGVQLEKPIQCSILWIEWLVSY